MAPPTTAGSASRGPPMLVLLPAALGLVLAALVLAPGAAEAAPPGGFKFHVGGPRGWRVPEPGMSYGWWASHNRFHVGDSLYFRYARDSVLMVDRAAFEACNATDPLAAFTDGATVVRLDRPGFFCFISGEPGHCQADQKLIVRVMVHPAAYAAAPAPTAQPGRGRPTPAGWPAGSASSAAAATEFATAVAVAVAAAAAVLFGVVM
ncbi:hypothetical protein ACP4OV_021098 [Aristida adscensionis]